MIEVRGATADDGAFLVAMLVLAAGRRPDNGARSAEEVVRDPSLAHYVAGWPRPGDVGVVAQDVRPLGAAWWRYFDALDPGYGFVAETVPELAIGVVPDARGQGIGRALLDELIGRACTAGIGALSLSVRLDNPALRLYRRCGFETAGTNGGSLTMILDGLRGADSG